MNSRSWFVLKFVIGSSDYGLKVRGEKNREYFEENVIFPDLFQFTTCYHSR